MSGVDAAWWHMSQPHNPMIIVGLLQLQRAPTLDALREIVSQRLLAHRRFRQRPAHGTDGDHWERDPRFRLERHVIRHRLSDNQSLQDWIAALCVKALPSTHPLWQLVLVEGGESAALVVRIHHCMADGSALIRLLLTLTEPESAGAAPAAPAATLDDDAPTSLLGDLRRLLADAEAVIAPKPAAAPNPVIAPEDAQALAAHLARIVVALGAEVIRLAEMPDETPTPLKQPPGAGKAVAWCEALPQREVKRVAQAFGCSVNAVLISCVAAALGAHLQAQGHETRKAEIRVLIPTPLRGTRRAASLHGNHFGLVNMLLPLGVTNPVARAWEVHRRLEALTGTRQALLMHLLLGIVGLLPPDIRTRALDLLSGKATAVLTMVPGPPAARTLAGARIDDMMFWVPQAGDIGLGLSILSYDGRMRVGLMSDATTLPQPAVAMRQVQAEFERLVPLAEMLAAQSR